MQTQKTPFTAENSDSNVLPRMQLICCGGIKCNSRTNLSLFFADGTLKFRAKLFLLVKLVHGVDHEDIMLIKWKIIENASVRGNSLIQNCYGTGVNIQ